jgi:chitosanase
VGSVLFGNVRLNISMDKKGLIKKILLSFEQSSNTIKYDKIYLWNDGPKNIKQITVSFGITEWGNLKKLIDSYIKLNGNLSDKFKTYLNKIGVESLANDNSFIELLKQAGKDPVMQMCQERAFDDMYIDPAYNFCLTNKLETPLSKLVISDSYLHSGSILSFLRNKFSEKIPANGGNEKIWTESYCKARKEWLENHTREVLRKTVYRMNFMLDRIKDNDWDLSKSSYNANGVKIEV